MAVADDKALRDLEYGRLKQLVRTFADSPLGEAAIDDLAPLDDRAAIEMASNEVNEAQSYLQRTGRFSLGGLHDLAALLQRAKESSCLDGEVFLPVLETIDATHRIRSVLLAQEDLPQLRGHAQRLSQMEDLAKQIYRMIDENGEIREDASPRLRELAKRKGTLEERIERKLRQVIDRNPDLISEPVITRRAGRLVLAVKSGAVGTTEFVVHDRSATGQTLYAEPTALVSENNAVAEIENGLREERLRILRELTTALKRHDSTFRRNQVILAHLDSLFARAGYAIAHRCAFPRFSERIALYEARHPLLPLETVVPISLHLGERHRMMVITGPNTGGKTVTLKTIGLLTLMTPL